MRFRTKLAAVALAAVALTGVAPADGRVTVISVVASWYDGPPTSGCDANTAQLELSGYVGTGANTAIPVNTGLDQMYLSVQLTRTSCDSGTVLGWFSYGKYGPRVNGPNRCSVGDGPGTYTQDGSILKIELATRAADADCATGQTGYFPDYYDAPMSVTIAIRSDEPAGAGVVDYRGP